MRCPRYTEDRPTDIELTFADPKKDHDTLERVRKSDHFGIRNKVYNVR